MYEETDPPSTGMDTKTGKSAGNGEVSTPLILLMALLTPDYR
jgi:hypothetical protein